MYHVQYYISVVALSSSIVLLLSSMVITILAVGQAELAAAPAGPAADAEAASATIHMLSSLWLLLMWLCYIISI